MKSTAFSLKGIVLAGVGLAVLTLPATAADMAVKARPIVAPVYSWNGWYVGGNFGYGGANELASQLVVSGAAFPIVGAGRIFTARPIPSG